VEIVEPMLRQQRHTLAVRTAPYEALYVRGDAARLVQCVSNLLSNAAKYTPRGGEISVRSYADADDVGVEVTDNGIGISADLLPRVFDLFVQSERSLERAEGGLGIGLAVVKRLIEMHDGEVIARSAGLGRGSTFTIRLPRINAPAAEAPTETPLQGEPRRLLIVDDNVDAADSLALLLTAQGHEVAVAYRPSEALARAEALRPEVALLDIGLPEMDGYELARRLRAMPQLQGMRLYALTGYGQAEDQLRSRAAGFDGHLIKPVDLQALERALAAQA